MESLGTKTEGQYQGSPIWTKEGETGKWEGKYSLWPIPELPRMFLYLPDEKEPLTYITSGQTRIVLDQIFDTDLASIPRWMWGTKWLNPIAWIPAALVHDWLWELHRRKEATIGFYESNVI